MSATTINGTFTSGYVLTTLDTNPVVFASTNTIQSTGSSALVANFAYSWSIQNAGLIQVVSGTAGASGIALGTASITNTTSGRIAGFAAGIYVTGNGTVSNQGTITSSLNSGSGYTFSTVNNTATIVSAAIILGSGSVTNAASAVISGALGGVGTDGAGSVSNAGTILGTQFGVFIEGGGSVSNAATGTIGGSKYGIYGGIGGALAVVNQGRIAASTARAVLLIGGGSVTNTSSGTIVGAQYGIKTGFFPATVVNAGLVTGTSRVGAYLTAGGQLSNASGGTLTGAIAGFAAAGTTATTATNAGSIGGYDFGAVVFSANAVFTNSGSVSSQKLGNATTFGGAAVALKAGGTVTNASGGHLTGRWIGVQIGQRTTAVGGTLINQGSIFASDGTNGAAVWIHGPAFISNASTGTINGGPFGIVAYYATTLINSGSIGGSIYAFDAINPGFANRVVVNPGGTFSGIVTGGNSIGSTVVSTLELASGASAGTLGGIGTQFVKFGQVTVDAGASWTLTGANTILSGATLTDSGTVINTGTVTGGIVLNGGVVTNASGATISSTFAAIHGPSSTSGGTIVNAGLLAGPSTGFGAGIALFSGGTITNQSTGTITGSEGIYVTAASTAANTAMLTNYGTILATAHQGVEFHDGGSITNASGATIAAAYTGVSIRFQNSASQSATVVNRGVIIGTSSYGVQLKSAGTDILTNAAGGVITGGQVGIYIGAGGTVINAGRIGVSGTGTAAAVFQAGAADRLVVVPGAVFVGVVDGGNTIGSSIVSTLELASGASAGTFTGLGTQFTDFARVTVDAGASWTFSGSNTVVSGSYLTDSGTLTNAGTVNGMVQLAGGTVTNLAGATITGSPAAVYGQSSTSAGTVFNAGVMIGGTNPTRSAGIFLGSGGYASNASGGSISAAGVGVYIFGAGTVRNAGSIGATGTNATNATGVEVYGAGLVSNASTGTITGAQHGVELQGAGSVINQGLIVASGSNSSGVNLRFGGSASNTGTVQGGQQGVLFGSGATGGTLTNAGAITGSSQAVQFAAGLANRLILQPGAVLSGIADGGNTIGATAASTLELGSGASNGTLSGIGAQFVDFAQIAIDAGASWVLTGGNSIQSGVTLTDSGTLTDAGTVTNSGLVIGVVSLASGALFANQAGGTVIASATVAAALYGVGGPSTVTNAGLIQTTNDTLSAVALTAGGTVINSGSISGSFRGVRFQGAAGTLINAGTITNSATVSDIALFAGGRVTNVSGGLLKNNQGSAIGGTNVAVSVFNAGVIISTGTAGNGVNLKAGGYVSNAATGTIAAQVHAGVYFAGSTGTVVNAGYITGGTKAGVALSAGGMVSNRSGGTLTGGGGVYATLVAATVLNAGQIIAGVTSNGVGLRAGGYVSNASGGIIQATSFAAVFVTNAIGAVFNAGTIRSSLSTSVVLDNGGAVTNQTGGTIIGRLGVFITGASGTVINAGLIQAATTSSSGVFLQAGGVVTNAATGTITGNFGVYVTVATGSVVNAGSIGGSFTGIGLKSGGTIVNTGAISGFNAIQEAAGFTNRLIVAPGASFVGLVNGGNTVGSSLVSTLELASAASTGTLSGIGTNFTNFAQVTIDAGAAWAFASTNSLVSGATLTNSGTIFANGLLNDNGVIDSNAGTVIVGSTAGTNGTLLVNSSGSLIAAGIAIGQAAGATGSVSVNGGTLTETGSFVIGGLGSGSLDIGSGGLVNAGTNRIDIGNGNGGHGTVSVGGGNARLQGGALAIASPGTGSATGLLSIGSGGTVVATSVSIGSGGTVALSGGLLDPPVGITVNAGGTIVGFGTLDAAILGAGTVIASGGLLDITGSIAGSGGLSIAAGATLALDGSVAATETVFFTPTIGTVAGGVLQLGTLGFSGTIDAFVQGESLILAGITGVTSVTFSGGTLDVHRTGNPDVILNLDTAYNYSAGTFSFFTAGGATVITDNVTPCYLAGTLILTDRGEIRVEDLVIGDRVATLDGTAKPIKWIGKRTYSSAFAAGNRDIIPVRIALGALGDNVPVRDLYVSPLHAMYLDEVLVQAEHLVNGVSVMRCPEIDPIRYFHIELERHDIVFANGAPAETFVDCDSRGMFHNAAEFASLYPSDRPERWTFCAPRIDSGAVLDRIRRTIDARAGMVPIVSGPLQGNLDGLDGTTITGWAFDPEQPDAPVTLEVLVGDGLIARLSANRFRSDLESSGIGDGRHGFELRLSRAFSPLIRRELRVRRVGDGKELPGSPLVIEARDRRTLVKDVQQAVDIASMAAGDTATLDALLETFQSNIDLIRRLRATQHPDTEGVDRLLRWAQGPRQQPKRVLIIGEKLPRRDRDPKAALLLSHIAALRGLGWEVEFVASAELARGDDAATALKAWGVTCHRAPLVASVEEVLRRKRNAFDMVTVLGLPNTQVYAPLARFWQPKARIVCCLPAVRDAGGRSVNAIRMVDSVVVHSQAELDDLVRLAPGVTAHASMEAAAGPGLAQPPMPQARTG